MSGNSDVKINRDKLSYLVRTAVDGMKQKGFADKAGISVSYFNRLAQGTFPGEIKESTLRRIAAASDGRVSSAQLLEACGLTEKLNMSEYNGIAMGEVAESISGHLSEGLEKAMEDDYLNVDDFIMAGMIYAGLDAENRYKNRILSYPSVKAGDDEYHVNAAVTTNLAGTDFSSAFSVIYVRKDNGTISPVSVRTDLDTLMEEKHPMAVSMMFGLANMGDVNYADYPYVYSFKKREIKSAEERLLETIFGGKDGKKAKLCFWGFGFYLDNGSDMFRKFLESHRETMEKDEALKIVAGIYLDEKKELAEYYESVHLSDGLSSDADVVAKIMKIETELSFTGWTDYDHEVKDNRNSVVIDREFMHKYNEEYVRQVTERYARELRLPRIETCYWYIEVDAETHYMRGKDLKYKD